MTDVQHRVSDEPVTRSIGLTATASVVFAITSIGFLLRTTGVHWDELMYRRAAEDLPFGDSAITGKPFLFYAVNYALMHTFGLVAGSLRPFVLPVLYACAFSAALTWAVAAMNGRAWSRATAWRAVALAISPIALLNSTALMMETAALVLISVAVGCIARARSAPIARYGLLAAAGAAAAVKATTVPALLLLAWAFRDRLRRDMYLIPVGIVVGLALNYAGLLIIAPKWQTYYGGVGELLSVTSIVGKLQTRGVSYLLLWLFMAGGIVGLMTLFEPSRWQDREFRVLALGSLVGVGALAAASVFEFARYCYPVIWAAVLGMIAASPGRGLLIGIIALHLVQGAPLFMHSPSRFSPWPSLITVELVDSGGTIFPGFPIEGLTLRQTLREDRPCIWINSENGEKNEVLEAFATFAFPQGRTFVSPHLDAGKPDSCSPANTVRVTREHVEGPQVGCTGDCRACRFQNIQYFFARPGWVRNQVCWPDE